MAETATPKAIPSSPHPSAMHFWSPRVVSGRVFETRSLAQCRSHPALSSHSIIRPTYQERSCLDETYRQRERPGPGRVELTQRGPMTTRSRNSECDMSLSHALTVGKSCVTDMFVHNGQLAYAAGDWPPSRSYRALAQRHECICLPLVIRRIMRCGHRVKHKI